VIRTDAGMSTVRFCQLIDMPERTWRRWQAKARAVGQPRGPWPRPARESAKGVTLKHALAHPVWGHRKIWVMVRHDGHGTAAGPARRTRSAAPTPREGDG
jgi:putative transposase